MSVRKSIEIKQVEVQRPERAKLSPEEALRRMQEFAEKRKENFVASVRKSKG